MEQFTILGVKVDALTRPELHNYIKSRIRQRDRAVVLHINVHGLNLAWKHAWLREFLNSAQLVFCDGFGVRLGARLLGFDIPERITYADWIWELGEFANKHNFTFFFLGDDEDIVKKAARLFQARFPNLNVVGTHHGYFDKTRGSAENQAVLSQIKAVNPDIVVVGLGMPTQEQWLLENWEQLNATVALTGGAVFKYMSGSLPRGPRWMTNNGLEWLARLLIEPRRLWRRYLLGNPLFLFRILYQRLGRSVSRPN